MVAKLALILLYAIPVAFVPAFLMRGEDDVSIAPNFALLGLLGFLVGLAVICVTAVRRQRCSWAWTGAALLCLAVTLVAGGAIDLSGFAGGKH